MPAFPTDARDPGRQSTPAERSVFFLFLPFCFSLSACTIENKTC